MLKVYCRIFQSILRIGHFFAPWRKPKLLSGENSLTKLPELIKNEKLNSVLVITDSVIVSIGLIDNLLNGLNNLNISYALYDKTQPNPTINNVYEALDVYKTTNCEGIIAYGGGSVIDCAKCVGAKIARPNKTILQLKGLLKVRKKLPPLFAVPTTSGTGSEATIAAVITNDTTHEKYAINDMALIPHYAILDPLLTINLPQNLTSTTGIDALTHAVEAYIGKGNTKETKEWARESIKLIFDNIFESYSNGNNLEARKNMQQASYLAGLAFTRAYVGNVHAIAHTLGGFYSIPHGLANAILLPHILEYYGKSTYKSLAELADLIEITLITDTNKEKAEKFIQALKNLNSSMNIPNKFDGILEKDIPLMVERAFKEANPLYPVPKILSKKDFFKIYKIIKK